MSGYQMTDADAGLTKETAEIREEWEKCAYKASEWPFLIQLTVLIDFCRVWSTVTAVLILGHLVLV